MAKSMWDIIARVNGKKTGDELVADRAKKERTELEAAMNQHNLNAAQAKAYLKMQRKMASEQTHNVELTGRAKTPETKT